MKSPLSYILFLTTFFSSSSYAICGDQDYIDTMSEIVEDKKQEIGESAQNFPTSLAVAQAILETGYGTSYSAKKRNNHFGIINSKQKLAVFQSIEHGVEIYLTTLLEKHYYTSFQRKLEKGESDPIALLKVLAPVYAEDKRYTQKVSTIIKACNLRALDA